MIVEVTSDKDPSIVYTVDPEAGTCSCPSYTQRLSKLNEQDQGTRVCKHVQRIREEQKGPA